MVPMGVLDPEYLAWGPKREASVLAARDNALREGRPSWLTSDDALRERRRSWLTSGRRTPRGPSVWADIGRHTPREASVLADIRDDALRHFRTPIWNLEERIA